MSTSTVTIAAFHASCEQARLLMDKLKAVAPASDAEYLAAALALAETTQQAQDLLSALVDAYFADSITATQFVDCLFGLQIERLPRADTLLLPVRLREALERNRYCALTDRPSREEPALRQLLEENDLLHYHWERFQDAFAWERWVAKLPPECSPPSPPPTVQAALNCYLTTLPNGSARRSLTRQFRDLAHCLGENYRPALIELCRREVAAVLNTLPAASAVPRPTDAVERGPDQLPTIADELHKPAGDAAKGSPCPSRMTRDEANAKAMELAKKDRFFVHRSQREWADAIGCSVGLVNELPLWQKTMETTGRGRKGNVPAPNAVSLTDNLEAVAGEGDKEEVLQRLLADHERDHEPSPLDHDPPGSRQRRVYNRKRL